MMRPLLPRPRLLLRKKKRRTKRRRRKGKRTPKR
jgi:hypothetical protein